MARRIDPEIARWRMKDRGGITLRAAAERIDSSEATLSRLLRGIGRVDQRTVERFVIDVLQMPLELAAPDDGDPR
jgi:hypothetical protein